MSVSDRANLRVRLARDARDLDRIRTLRAAVFPADGGPCDPLDDACRHVLVDDPATGAVAASFRLLSLPDAGRIGESYAARHYDLGRLGAYPGPVAEIGRFCIAPAAVHADILRLAWGALARIADADGVRLLFGCTSFPGTDSRRHRAALAHLAARHQGPARWSPGRRAARIVPLAGIGRGQRADPAGLPPLLRTYLGLGGWVGDHAVIDTQMDTLHVFTGVELARIPAARMARLRGLAAAMPDACVDLCRDRA